MPHVFIRVVRALRGLALLIRALVAGQQPRLRASQLLVAEAVLLHALGFHHQRAQALRDLALRHLRFDLEQLQRTANAACPRLRREEGRIGTAGDFAESEIQHLRNQALDERVAISADCFIVLGLALEADGDRPALRFRIRRHVDQRLLVGRHAGVHGGCRALRRGNAGEVLLDERFRLGDRDVTDDDHGHVVRAIPRLVKLEQPLAWRGLEHLGQSDRQPLRVARSLEDHRQLLVRQSRSRPEAAAPFFENNAALLLDFGGQERDAGREIAQHQHAAIDIPGPIGRHLQHVDGFVEGRRGVDVRAEARADRLEERHQLAGLEVLGAVKSHVLEEVRKPSLIRLLLDRAGIHGQPHRDALGRARILPDEVAEPVRQPAGLHRRIDGQRSRQREFRRNGRGRLRRTCPERSRRATCASGAAVNERIARPTKRRKRRMPNS